MQVVSRPGGTTVSMPLGRSTLQMVEKVSWPGRLPESAPTSPGGRIAQEEDADATPRLASTCSSSHGCFQRNRRRAQGTAEAASRLQFCPAPEGARARKLRMVTESSCSMVAASLEGSMPSRAAAAVAIRRRILAPCLSHAPVVSATRGINLMPGAETKIRIHYANIQEHPTKHLQPI